MPPPHSRDDRNSPLYQQIGWYLRLTNICLGYPQNLILYMFISHAAGIIGMSHHSQQSFTLSAGEWARILARHYGQDFQLHRDTGSWQSDILRN
jgi:hypothetical protein